MHPPFAGYVHGNACELLDYYAHMTIVQILQDYGYPAVLLGTALEGETILLLGGMAAHLGLLSLKWVIVCAFFGSLLGDQLFFLLGRRHGKAFLAKRPTWQQRSERVFRIMERHQNLLIVGFRFLYGLRTITPFALGTSRVSYMRFAILNTVGAAMWSIAIGSAGFYFGQVAERLLGDVKHYQLALMGGIAAIASLVWVIRVYRRQRATSR